MLFNQTPSLPYRGRTLPRIDAGERNQDVGMLGTRRGDFLVRDRRMAGRRLGVDGEHDRGDSPLPVVLGQLRNRGLRIAGTEVCRLGRLQHGTERGMAVGRHLGVRMHVDRDQLVEVHDQPSTFGAGIPTVCGSRPTVVAHASAIAAASHPPSRKATDVSSGCDHNDSRSPPMPMHWPVTSLAASEARNTTTGAASSGVPKPTPRRSHAGNGSPRCCQASTYGANAGMVEVIAVAAIGTTPLTVMPARAHSIDQVRTMPMIPALAAE